MKKISTYFLKVLCLTFIFGVTFSYYVAAQVASSDFTAINWGTAAAQQYSVNEAQGKVLNGKLYAFGGFDSRKAGLLPTKRSYIYNSQTNVWSPIADLPYLPNGNNFGGVTHAGIATDGTDIYLAAGVTADSAGTGSIEGTKQVWKYIVSQNAYVRLPDLPVEIAGGQLEYLNGELHYLGGFIEERETDVATHYVLNLNDLDKGWATLAPLPNPRQHAGSTVFGGKIYSIGGQIGEGDTLITQKTVNVFDPAANSWIRLADLPVPAGANGRGHISSAVVISGERIIVLGGETVHKTGQTDMVSAYSPATNTWQNLTPLPSKRFSGLAAVLNGNIFYSGGSYTNITYKGVPTTPGLSFSSANLQFYATQNTSPANKTMKLSSNQGTPQVSLSKSVNSDWLILPSPAIGSLSFGINVVGLLPGNYTSTVTAASSGYTDATFSVNLSVYPSGTLVPLSDSYIRDGSYAAINYGNDSSLYAKSSATSGFTRSTYLKFSLNNVSNIATAKLLIYGSNTDNASSVNISSYGVNDDSWTESSITRNNAPSASTGVLSTTAVNNLAKYYEFDVTSYVTAQAAGDKIASLLIKDPSNQNKNLVFNSKENRQNPPQLIITTNQEDTISPVVNVRLNGTSNTPNTYNNSVEIIINSSDSGGSRLASTEYSLNDTAFQTYRSSFIINTPGNYTIKARATDGNKNVAVTNDIAFTIASVSAPLYDTLTPIADAFTCNGSYSTVNYGNDTALVVKSSATSGYTRLSYLKFSLGNVSNIASATLRIYGRNIDNAAITAISSFGVNNDTWTESGITSKNAPVLSTAALSAASVSNEAKYYEFDVTSYAKSQFDGDKIISLALKDLSNQNINLTFNSKEKGQNRPQLIIKTSSNTSGRTLNNTTVLNDAQNHENSVVFPNPVHKEFKVKFPVSYRDIYNLQISDLSGKVYNIRKVEATPGMSAIYVDISHFALSPGLYFLHISSKGINENIKLIIQ